MTETGNIARYLERLEFAAFIGRLPHWVLGRMPMGLEQLMPEWRANSKALRRRLFAEARASFRNMPTEQRRERGLHGLRSAHRQAEVRAIMQELAATA